MWPLVAFTGVAFSAGSLLSKGLVDDGVDPFTVTWAPFLAAGVLGVIVGRKVGHLDRQAFVPGAVLGLIGSAAPALLFNLGFERLPTGIVTLLIALGPAVTAVIAHFVFADERFNPTKALGLVVAIIGVSILAAGSLDGGASIGAIAMVMVGSAIGGGAGVVTRIFAKRHSGPALLAPQLLVGGVSALTLSTLLGRDALPDAGFESWQLATLPLFGVTTFLGFLAMLSATEIGTTGQVSVIGYCVPVLGVVGGIVFFGDDITVSLIVGGLLILVAVGIIASGSRAPTGATGPTIPLGP